MDIHKNARLTPKGRERILRQVLSGQTPKAAAFAVGVCPRTVRKWLTRYSIEGQADRREDPNGNGDKPPRRRALRPIVVNGPTTERAGRPPLEKRFDLHSRGKGSICPLTLPLNKVESAIE